MATDKLMIAVLMVLVFLVTFSADAWCQDKLIELSDSVDYQILHIQEWQNTGINKEQLNRIVRDILNVQTYEPTFVSEFLAKDFNRDGKNEIIASVNERCTSDPVMFVLLFRIGDRLQLQEFRTHMGNINRDVKDINGDGNFEVITKKILAESTCHAECVEWPTIYKWDGRRYIEENRDFPEYYKKIVENLDAGLKQLSEVDLEELAKSDKRSKEELAKWQQFRIADTQVAKFKAKQLLGEGKAGFDHAVQWSSSTERQLRRNAVTVFAGIMDSKSRRYLQKLATDSDATVARSAKAASEEMTKWGPPLSEEEKARIAKLSTTELVNLLRTGTTLQRFAALRELKANGGWKKNFDLLLSIAGDRGGFGEMIVEGGLVYAVDESASAEDRRRVDKFVDFLESELKKDKPAILHTQAVRSLGKAVHSPLRLPGGIRPGRERPPYGYQRVMGILTSCLDNTDWNVREVAFRWLGILGEQDPAMNKKIIATLEAQMAKEEASEEEESVKENRRKEMEDTLRKLRSRLRESATPGGLVRPPDGI